MSACEQDNPGVCYVFYQIVWNLTYCEWAVMINFGDIPLKNGLNYSEAGGSLHFQIQYENFIAFKAQSSNKRKGH